MSKLPDVLSLLPMIAFLTLPSCRFIHRLPGGTVIDHEAVNLAAIPSSWIVNAKNTLHIAYGHTSHGSQLVTGMSGLDAFMGGTGLYAWNDGGADGALDLRDTPFSGAQDLGNPDRTVWEQATRTYLNDPANDEINVVIWSWCGQVSSSDESDIDSYLGLMSGLERDFPDVAFVYMTGHLDGTGLSGNLHLRNEQIRAYCRANSKWLYDFEDIESYDPDGTWYGDRYPTDGCNYDNDGSGGTGQTGDPAEPVPPDRNWATDWQNAHPGEWFVCSPSHTKPLNGNRKAFAAWWLWARLGGWSP